MGSWNGTCAISNLHIHARQKVAVFLLLKNNEPRSFCYGNALYDICPIPFYGEYNDYGAVENCYGFGRDIVVEALRAQLYEFGQGPNEYHDCVVNRQNFDIELLFDADHEDRLGVEHRPHFNMDEYDKRELEKKRDERNGLTAAENFELDRLINKIKKVDTFRQVTHVIVHGDVMNAILDKWYIEDYVGDGKGNQGYGNNYTHFYFKDLVASIPEYIRRIRVRQEEIKKIQAEMIEDCDLLKDPVMLARFNRVFRGSFDWNDPCQAGRWMEQFKNSSNQEYGLIHVPDVVNELSDAEEWEDLADFTREVLTTSWINSFMSHTRKIWTKQTGAGSQNQEPLGYQVLAESVLSILKAEHDEYAEDEDEIVDETDTEEAQ